jgi:hypothetical protein
MVPVRGLPELVSDTAWLVSLEAFSARGVGSCHPIEVVVRGFVSLAAGLGAVLVVGSTAAAPNGRARMGSVDSQSKTVWVEFDGTSRANYTNPTTPATIEDWSDAEQWHYVWRFAIPLPLTGSNPLSFTPFSGTPRSDSFLQVKSHITYGASAGGKPCDQSSTTTDGHISRIPGPSIVYPSKKDKSKEDFTAAIPDGALCGLSPWHLEGALPLAMVEELVDLNRLRPRIPDTRNYHRQATVSDVELEWQGTLRISLEAPPRVKPPPPTGSPPHTTPTPPPTGCQATISSVKFDGSAANPSLVVRGTFCKRPSPNPSGHPSGLNGCPVVAGDEGYDYGTSLYLADPARNWSGGRYRPSLGETDCIDLIVTKFTSAEVDFHFGPFYIQNHPKFSLDTGDSVQIVVNDASTTVSVSYS